MNPETLYARAEDAAGIYKTSEVTIQVLTCLLDDTYEDAVENEKEDLRGNGLLANNDDEYCSYFS
jgi:hypothetical protein